jgi:hypothetical protein
MKSSKGFGFGLFALAVTALTAFYVARRLPRSTKLDESSGPTSIASGSNTSSELGGHGTTFNGSALERLRVAPHVYARSVRHDEYGRIEIAALSAPDAERIVTDLKCDRFSFGRTRGICLVDNRINLTPPAKALLVDRALAVVHTIDLAGLPSRARISSDERFAVATVFTVGDDYKADFSTRTTLLDVRTGNPIADLEEFKVLREGAELHSPDFNFWGVTFKADSSQFFATLATKGKTYLVEGDIARREVHVLRENVECPSLSPDQKHLVFKSKLPNSEWRLHALDLANGREWELTQEQRSVDDQVAWLDDGHVLYRILEEHGEPELALNIWVAAIDPAQTEPVKRFMRSASSPSVSY